MSDSLDLVRREAAPVAARGHNLVLVSPPGPSWAGPVLDAALSRVSPGTAPAFVGLAPVEAIGEWARVAARAAQARGLRVAAGHSTTRLARLAGAGSLDALVVTPETALELVRRSALDLGAVTSLLLAWPDAWEGEASLVALTQDLPREAQRIVVTANLKAAGALIERYCWRAPVVDLLDVAPTEPIPALQTAPVAWRSRAQSLADLTDQLDPATMSVWVADPEDANGVAAALATTATPFTVSSEDPDPAALVVAYDLPTPSRLHRLAERGPVLLLVPPGAETYAAGLAQQRKPVHLHGATERAQVALASARRMIAEVLERGPAAAGFLTLAPLFERYEAPAVAAAVYELWAAEGAPVARGEPRAPARAGPPGRLWIGAGKKDGISPNDLVAVLVRECGVHSDGIGKIEIRETFTIVELAGGADAEAVADRLTGKVIRKRRLVARVDRGARPAARPRGGERPQRG